MTTPNRRSMSIALKPPALSPEALALIKEGTQAPLAPKLAVESPASPKEETARPSQMVVVAEKPAEPTSTERPKQILQKQPEPSPVVGLSHLSVRLPAEIPHALLRASLDRKLKRIKPWTQQEILQEALTSWLRKNNYLN